MIYTIGHSTLPLEDFVKMMKDTEIDILMDIRSHPTSKWPQFRKENLEITMPENGFEYEWQPGLGGWDVRHAPLMQEMAAHGVNITAYTKGKFPKQQIAKDHEANVGKPQWTNKGLFEYSWFMTLPEFFEAADKLMFRARTKNIAIMCCECLWWKCHRSLVSDYLWSQGIDSIHLQPKMTQHSKAIGNRLERYDLKIQKLWTKQYELVR